LLSIDCVLRNTEPSIAPFSRLHHRVIRRNIAYSVVIDETIDDALITKQDGDELVDVGVCDDRRVRLKTNKWPINQYRSYSNLRVRFLYERSAAAAVVRITSFTAVQTPSADNSLGRVRVYLRDNYSIIIYWCFFFFYVLSSLRCDTTIIITMVPAVTRVTTWP